MHTRIALAPPPMSLPRRAPSPSRRAGFTLIEMLVILAIVSILMGLLLVSIQGSRAAADRLGCANNLAQIGKALAQHQGTYGIFPPRPPSSLGTRGSSCAAEAIGWPVFLLPFLDQNSLWTRVQTAYRQEPEPDFDSLAAMSPHQLNLETLVQPYLCPADGRLRTVQEDPAGVRGGFFSYAGVTGYSADYQSGLFGQGKGVDPARIRDGMSQTLAVGERPPPSSYQTGWWYAAHSCTVPSSTNDYEVAADSGTDSGDVACGGEVLAWPGGAPGASHYFQSSSLADPCGRYHYWSLHPGGANFLFIDGSVRFLPYSAKFILRKLATIAGNEVIADDAL